LGRVSHYRVRAVTALALLCTSFDAAQAQEPAAGQTVDQWQNAVTASLAAQGDKMGYAVEKCALRPSFAGAQETYLARGFSKDATIGTIALIAVNDGKVTRWQEFELPGFEGWITRFNRDCKGSLLELRERSRVTHRYRWDGQAFKQVAKGGPRRRS
jgi:hypothetical protein